MGQGPGPEREGTSGKQPLLSFRPRPGGSPKTAVGKARISEGRLR